ncbi:MAG: FliG C-terminal domain-containing protein [Planctomycetota bacterium]|jgi:flagellar motor switch protein FliG
MLLISLDAASATELLKGVDTEKVEELAAELAHLDAAGYQSPDEGLELVRQFCNSLEAEKGFGFKGLLREMLKTKVGIREGRDIEPQTRGCVQNGDPLMEVRCADSWTIASVLEGEHPQAAAVVLSELPGVKSSEVLGFLREGIRLSAINRMTSCDTVTAEAKLRILETVCRRVATISGGGDGAVQTRPDRPSRQVPEILRRLGRKLREGMFGTAQQEESEAGERTADSEIVWQDISRVADESLQSALGRIEAHKLALALVGAEEVIAQSTKSNISENTAAVLEEVLPTLALREADIEEAREEIVEVLREMNRKGELRFIAD